MNLLNNLSLRVKLLLVVIPILLGLTIFAFLQAKENYDFSNQMSTLDETITLSIELGGLAHEIQKERGNSSGFISSSGTQFGDALAVQRQLTNAQLETVRENLDQYEETILANYSLSVSELRLLLKDISSLRLDVDNLNITANEAIAEYTKINTLALSIVERFGTSLGDVQMFSQSEAYSNFLKSKERAGIERALGTQAFVLGLFNPSDYIQYANLVAEQNAYIESFLRNATQDAKVYYTNSLDIAAVGKVEEMRQQLFANANFSVEPQYWFDQITLKINALKEVEDYLAAGISQQSNELASQANNSFIVTVVSTLAATILVMVLLFAILSNLLGNINKLSVFSSRVAKGELRARVKIQSKDELGRFGAVMNRMVGSVKKASDQLKVERNKARYLYKTIYRTSEIVFANVSDGVFLIDSDLKISNLYSKSTEGIFEQEEVGGKNFLDFVNPRLLPRDREALKVFSKHLFNPKIKDRVLANLNPVESVSIYGEDQKSANVKAKYLQISFQRIKGEKGMIKEVMVTSKDVTQEVMLKKQIEENQKKNKKETDQLLNIIKMDPSSLTEYLDRAFDAIEDINKSFEDFKGTDFRELVIYTFNIIHNLKGNAGLIEFDLIEGRFNEVEEMLIELRNRDIDGEDFIKVLYEIKDIQFSMMEIGRMLRRIASIYQSSKDAEGDSAKDSLEQSFEKIVNKLNDTTNKEARFRVVNEEDVEIPDHLKIPVKDIVIQLIRNSFAHGIEDVETREKNGKALMSSVRLTLNSNKDELLLKYEDDGAGIDVSNVYDRAKSIGVFDPEKKQLMGDKYAYDLIFNDGLSTNEKQGLSGRGQGMSLIKSLVDRHEATYEIQSETGKGFSINIQFPLESKIKLTQLTA